MHQNLNENFLTECRTSVFTILCRFFITNYQYLPIQLINLLNNLIVHPNFMKIEDFKIKTWIDHPFCVVFLGLIIKSYGI